MYTYLIFVYMHALLIVELDTQNHHGDGISGPSSTMVVRPQAADLFGSCLDTVPGLASGVWGLEFRV